MFFRMRGGVKGWRGGTKRKKDSWTWITVLQLQGERSGRGINGNGKNTIKEKIKMHFSTKVQETERIMYVFIFLKVNDLINQCSCY